jgi:hypothetical protein
MNKSLNKASNIQFPAQYTELLDIFAEIIAFDLLKKTENIKKEDQNV